MNDLSEHDKEKLDKAVELIIRDYSEVLKQLSED